MATTRTTSNGNGKSTVGGRGRGTTKSAGAVRAITSSRQASFTVPGLAVATGSRVADVLQQRLVSLVDLSLTLKHVHWNVVGPNFASVHELLDSQHRGVEKMVDDLAERIATLGGVPSGLPGRLTRTRDWDDYSLDRADSLAHLGALDVVYIGIIGSHRAAMAQVGDDDRVSEDLLIGQTGTLERYHWFVRSHLADWAGGMANAGARSELAAGESVATKSRARRPAVRTARAAK
jgi:starvation-inducible DNA-binding protein